VAGSARPSSLAPPRDPALIHHGFTFPPANLYSRRYQISITLPKPVIGRRLNLSEPSKASGRRGAGHDNNSAEY
jgi:hypothetical protein